MLVRNVFTRTIDKRIFYAIVIIAVLFLFFLPKQSTIKVVSGSSTYCKCLGFEKKQVSLDIKGEEDYYGTLCYGVPRSCVTKFELLDDF